MEQKIQGLIGVYVDQMDDVIYIGMMLLTIDMKRGEVDIVWVAQIHNKKKTEN